MGISSATDLAFSSFLGPAHSQLFTLYLHVDGPVMTLALPRKAGPSNLLLFFTLSALLPHPTPQAAAAWESWVSHVSPVFTATRLDDLGNAPDPLWVSVFSGYLAVVIIKLPFSDKALISWLQFFPTFSGDDKTTESVHGCNPSQLLRNGDRSENLAGNCGFLCIPPDSKISRTVKETVVLRPSPWDWLSFLSLHNFFLNMLSQMFPPTWCPFTFA